MFLNFLSDISIILYIKLWVIKLNTNTNFNLINAVQKALMIMITVSVCVSLCVCNFRMINDFAFWNKMISFGLVTVMKR